MHPTGLIETVVVLIPDANIELWVVDAYVLRGLV